MLVQPEHILSFELMGLECYITDKSNVGHALISTQDFLERNARDIVDESDENFSVRFELIYTMGNQRPIEWSPGRWTIIQRVFDLVRELAIESVAELPGSYEISSGVVGDCPPLRIIRPDAEQLLVH